MKYHNKAKDRDYPGVPAGKWVQPARRGYGFMCCDCGLVHRLDFRVRNGRAQMRAFRDRRETARVRRARGRMP